MTMRGPHVSRYSRLLWESAWNPATQYFVIAGNAILILGVTLFHLFERGTNPAVRGWFDSLWWGMTTVTTVGFGDIVPTTTAGRFVGMALMLSGVSFFVGFTAMFVSTFSGRVREEVVHAERLTMREHEAVMAELRRIHARLDTIEQKRAKE